MKLYKKYRGIRYEQRTNTGDPSRKIWEGGVAGGTVFVSVSGKFGNASKWYDTFAEAADVRIEEQRKIYEIHKKFVDEYEASVPARYMLKSIGDENEKI